MNVGLIPLVECAAYPSHHQVSWNFVELSLDYLVNDGVSLLYTQKPKLYHQYGLEQSGYKIFLSLMFPKGIRECLQIVGKQLLPKERINFRLIFLMGIIRHAQPYPQLLRLS